MGLAGTRKMVTAHRHSIRHAGLARSCALIERLEGELKAALGALTKAEREQRIAALEAEIEQVERDEEVLIRAGAAIDRAGPTPARQRCSACASPRRRHVPRNEVCGRLHRDPGSLPGVFSSSFGRSPARRNGNWKMANQRLAPETQRSRTETLEIADQRLGRIRLNH